MNIRRLLVAIVALYILLWGEAMLFYNVLLAGPLASANALLQSEAAAALLPFNLAAYFVMVSLFCYIFTKNHEGRGIGEGIRYGLLLGGFSATVEFVWATSAGLTPGDAILVGLVAIVMWAVAGALLALIYQPSSDAARA